MREHLLDDLMDAAEGHAHEVFFDHGAKSLVPVFFWFKDDDTLSVIACPWANDFEKRVMVAHVQDALHHAGARGYSFAIEAWFASAPEGVPESELHHYRAADRPDRREGIICCSTDGLTTNWRTWQIVRDANGKVERFSVLPIGKEDQFKSPFAELLTRRAD